MDTDLDRSLATARKLLALAEKRQTPLTPQNYEILFRYIAGYDKRLIEKVDSAFAGDGLTESLSEEIHHTCIGGGQQSEVLSEVGARLSDEIGQAISVVATAKSTASAYGDSLKAVDSQLSDVKGNAELRLIIETLVLSSREMELNSRELEAKLAKSSSQIESLNERLEEMRTEMAIDPLTGSFNRRHFDEMMKREMQAAEETGQELCQCICDIDRFKAFNDTYGHHTGDHVLRLVAQAMSAYVKGHGVAARYGGEEFAILLPKTTLPTAVTLADQIHKKVRAKELIKRSSGETLGRVTISIGVARYAHGELPDELMRRAERCLYAAKHAGRDQVVCETDKVLAQNNAAA